MSVHVEWATARSLTPEVLTAAEAEENLHRADATTDHVLTLSADGVLAIEGDLDDFWYLAQRILAVVREASRA